MCIRDRDSARGTVEIVDRRVAKKTSTIDSIVDSDFVLSARRLTSFAGQIISGAPVSGNISRNMNRPANVYIKRAALGRES